MPTVLTRPHVARSLSDIVWNVVMEFGRACEPFCIMNGAESPGLHLECARAVEREQRVMQFRKS